jgi:hypothetical protein
MLRTTSFPVLIILAALSAGVTRADDAAPAKGDASKKEESAWQKYFRQQASGYELLVDGEKEPATLIPDPVLLWNQPVRGGDEGAVYLWTQHGRPVAIGTLFIWPAGSDGLQGVTHELHALTDSPFVGNWNNRRWTVGRGAVEFQPLAAKDAPADSPERRLLQMKSLARSFSATSHGKDDRDWELRLLPRPIYRYQVEADDKSRTFDGSLFGFVQGTDLEVVLAIEAVKTDSGSPGWRFACARMSDLPLVVKQGFKSVWEVGKATFNQSESPYFCGAVEYRKEPTSE